MNEIIPFEKWKFELERIKDISELLDFTDKIKVCEQWAKLKNSSMETQNAIAEFRLRGERKIGDWLKDNIKKGGIGANQYQELKSSNPTLADLNITKDKSAEMQRLANIEENYFDEYIEKKKAEKQPLTFSGIIKGCNVIKKQNRDLSIEPLPKGKYQLIYCDPPWEYGNMQSKGTYHLEEHYQTMTIKELEEMKNDIDKIKDDNCILYLWVTSPVLDVGINLMQTWGFKYKSSMIWDKIKHNMGFYSSMRHEILLIGTIGSGIPDDLKAANQTNSVQRIEKTKHSKKPKEFYEIIDRLHGKKNKIELFARGNVMRKGWTYWGNESE